MISKVSLVFIFAGLLVDAEALAQTARPLDPAYPQPLAVSEPLPLDEASPVAGVPMGALAPEREGCEISGGMEIKDNSQGMGMGYQEHPPVQNIGECWTHGLRALKKQLSHCQAPNEFFVRMQFKKGPKLLRDERRGVCHGENRNIASQPESGGGGGGVPIPSKKPRKHRGKKRWHSVGEPGLNEGQPLIPPESAEDQPLPPSEGL